MKKTIAVTQRVVEAGDLSEKRDSIDQRWFPLLERCSLLPLLLPNHLPTVRQLLLQYPVSGFVLTGGGDLVRYGGNSPERDEVERFLLTRAVADSTPLFGVCRGMQAIQEFYGVGLESVEGHVMPRQEILMENKPEVVNSYHNLGTRKTSSELVVWAAAKDGVVKAIRHKSLPLVGVMWHPERMGAFSDRDVGLLTAHFSKTKP